ncbi:MAG: cbb3-type cytochrome c oxidase subunit I, partial [Chloroflexota bacterium]
FHYVLFGGAFFGIMGGMVFWWPKITGRLLSEKLGKISFWLLFAGFNLTFGPMHFLGVDGMPRRIYTYGENQGWSGGWIFNPFAAAGEQWVHVNWLGWNMVCTIGAFTIMCGTLVFIYNIFQTMRRPKDAGNDPWDGATLEWGLPSPPPIYNFAVPPVVRSRDAYWAWKRRPQAVEAGDTEATVTVGGHAVGHVEIEEPPSEAYLAQEQNERHIDPSTMHLPNPSFFPLITAAGLVCLAAGVIFGYALSVAGVLYMIVGIGGWALEPAS